MDAQDAKATLDAEARDVAKRIARLVAAIESGGDAPSLVAKVKTLEARQREIVIELKNLRPIPRLAPQVIEDRLAEWRRLLRQSTTTGRAVLQRIIRGRITCTPPGQGYTFEAPTRFDGLFSGIVVPRSHWGNGPQWSGTEHIRPEDVGYGGENDVDYGRLLDEAMGGAGKEVRPQRDSNPCFGLERATS